MPSSKQSSSSLNLILIVIILALAGGLIYFYLEYTKTAQNLSTTLIQTASSTLAIDRLNIDLATTMGENDDLNHTIEKQQRQLDDFEEQIDAMTHKVKTLDLLSKTDPELLKKYFRVSFLNENYIPENLTAIPKEITSEPTRSFEIRKEVLGYLTKLINKASDDGVVLRIASSYRSFGQQAALKAGYKVTYGIGSNQFSADQGYSEHQLGTTIDFTTPSLGGGLTGFDKKPEYTWLIENAYRYGFVLSYPPNNVYYQYEPWHWRFVGTELAAKLHDEKKNFYDFDQRAIDPYLVSIFD